MNPLSLAPVVRRHAVLPAVPQECLKLIQTSVQKHLDMHRCGDDDGDGDDENGGGGGVGGDGDHDGAAGGRGHDGGETVGGAIHEYEEDSQVTR